MYAVVCGGMDLNCDDEIKFNFCKLNLDGGDDLNVALLISDDNSFNNSSSDDIFDIQFAIIPIDRYGTTIEQLNIAYEFENETWADEFPKDFYVSENIYKIQLEFQNLTKIKSSAFSGAYNLIEIDLDHNQILYIGEDAFFELKNLTQLTLTKNNLTIIRSNTFAGAVNLKRLHLNQNKIEHIEDGALNLPNLENILLQNNRLTILSGSIFISTPCLKEAVFEENELMQINEAFTHLHRLETLILDYNQIEDINLIKLAHLTELNHLSLRKSGFNFREENTFDIDTLVNSTSKLEYLDLADNGLSDSTIMLKLRMFERIEIINFEYNDLKYLDHAYKIKKWFPRLKIINLAYNPISCEWIDHFVGYLGKVNLKVYPWLNSANGCISDEEL